MSDYTVRVLRPDEHRAAGDLFRSALHIPAATDDEWKYAERAYQPGRALGSFDTELIGTVRSFDAEVTVPGGKRAALAAVTGVGVRPDRIRRGVLTELMRTQLADFAGRGVALATLYASEGGIYGRFGYGVATLARNYTVDRRRAVLRPEVPAGGEVELLGLDATFERVPEIYAGLPHTRPGLMTRPPYWWPVFERHARQSDTPVVTVVHHGPQGPDGFVTYTVERKHGHPVTLDVIALHTATSEAFAGLWRYLLGVDLVDTINATDRPIDEPTALLFTDPRVCSTAAGGNDDIWLRLVDVPAALAVRGYEGEPVVLELVDPVLEDNSGRYLVSADQVRRTDAPAELRLGVDALAMLYFGAFRASELAAVGRVQPIDPEAVARADRLFGTRISAWCGTQF